MGKWFEEMIDTYSGLLDGLVVVIMMPMETN
jgi:hypothetical protein